MFQTVEHHLERELPFVVYRKPMESGLTAVFQSDAVLHHAVDFQERGFVFAPFQLEEGVVYIQPDVIVKADFDSLEKPAKNDRKVSEEGKEAHLDLVTDGIHIIEKGILKKVVLSRKIDVGVSRPALEIFTNVLASYPNAFCYLFHHPKVGMWCGATPETLVKVDNGALQTMSLAATLPYVEGTTPEWGSKELEEQKMVSDYIESQLGDLTDGLYIGKAESVKAGNLWHLRSEVNGTIRPEAGLYSIVDALHPTPAVCGIPTQIAQEFILEHENYQRTYYTGFLGELNLYTNGEAMLFVNLRCMELKGETASLFVGGGITEASIPESEWLETQNKSRTMLNIL